MTPDPTSAGSTTGHRVVPSWRLALPTGWLRTLAVVFAVPVGTPRLHSCPTCGRQMLGGRGGPAVTAAGRCTDCGVRIGSGPWLMEIALLAAVAVVLLGARRGPELPAYLWFAVLGVVLAFVDATVRRLPNLLTAAWAVGTLTALGLPALTQDRTGDWLRALLGGVVLMAVFGLLALVRPAAMGWGDVKAAGGVGIALGWLSWVAVYAGVTLAFFLAAGYAVVLLVRRRGGRGTQLPLGPFLVIGALVAAALLPAAAR